jgi:excinuclease UvrABC helicase subunit UvrB
MSDTPPLSSKQILKRKHEIHKEIYQLENLMEQIKQRGEFEDYVRAWDSHKKLQEEYIQLDISFWELDNN